MPWGLQWKKPSELEAYTYLFGGITSLLIGATLLLLRWHYQAEFPIISEQGLELSSRREEQLETTIPLESSPPTYDEAVQWIRRIETT
jgi:hypothetical protein